MHLNVIDAYDFHNNVTYTSSSDSLMKPGEVLVLFLICAFEICALEPPLGEVKRRRGAVKVSTSHLPRLALPTVA